MTNERIIQIDSVDAYNKLYGWETLHPLVTVANHPNPMASDLNHSRLRSTLVALLAKNYGLYALFLKQDAVIEHSKQLLIETRLPVSEIAYQLGFEYPQHFSRLFKSRTGMTPNAYRLTA